MPLAFLPALPATLLEPLGAACAALGLPAPRRVQALRRPGALGAYLVTDERGEPSQLTVVLSDLGGHGVFGALVAARRLEGDLDLPVPTPVIALPLQALGCPAILHPLPAGRPADATGDAARALRALGLVLDAVARRPQPERGAGANAWRYLPLAGSWGAEWAALAARWAALARRGGTALEPMTSALLARIDPQALPLDGEPVLVPGGLAPGALWLDERGELVGVDGWLPSWCGDRWSAWAPLLHLRSTALASVAAAHARPPRLSPETARLEAYAAGHVLLLLAEAAAAPGPHERVRGLERALLAWEALPSLADRLAAADEGRELDPPGGVDRAGVLAVMDRLVREPALADADRWQAIAGAALLAHHVGADPALGGWREVARRSVALLEPGGEPTPWTEAPPEPPPDEPGAWILRWIGAELRAAAGGQAPPGFEAALDRLARRPPVAERPSPVARLAEALLGLAALARLQGEHEARRARLVAQAREAWEPLDFGAPAPDWPPGRYLRYFADPDAHEGQGQPVGLLLFAFARAGALPLPAPPTAVLRALGVQPR